MEYTQWLLADSEVSSLDWRGADLVVVFAAAQVCRRDAGVDAWGYLRGLTLVASGVEKPVLTDAWFGRITSGALAPEGGGVLVRCLSLSCLPAGPQQLELSFANGARLAVRAQQVDVHWPESAPWHEAYQC